jgi:hypothetical protein
MVPVLRSSRRYYFFRQPSVCFACRFVLLRGSRFRRPTKTSIGLGKLSYTDKPTPSLLFRLLYHTRLARSEFAVYFPARNSPSLNVATLLVRSSFESTSQPNSINYKQYSTCLNNSHRHPAGAAGAPAVKLRLAAGGLTQPAAVANAPD